MSWNFKNAETGKANKRYGVSEMIIDRGLKNFKNWSRSMGTFPYHCTLVCNESEGMMLSVVGHDCAANQGECKHTVPFLI